MARTKKGINVSQRKYTLDLLHETRMLGTQPKETPIEEGCHLKIKPQGVPIDSKRYRRLMGKLIYLTHTSRYQLCNWNSKSVHASAIGRTHGGYIKNFELFET